MLPFRKFTALAMMIQASACSTSASPPDHIAETTGIAGTGNSGDHPKNITPQPDLVSLNGLVDTKLDALDFADQRFKEAGIAKEFTASLHRAFIDRHSNWREDANRIIELNVFGFLAHSDYSLHDSPKARAHIASFLKQHRKSFKEARKKYDVSSSTIASLLWVETKHGKVMGKFPVGWVYFALSLSAHPDFTREMLKLLPSKLASNNPKNLSLREAEVKVIERCKSKSLWAIDEMKALDFIHEAKLFNPLKTKSSFAGAFGLGQFIPSTYLKFSESLYRKKADLFKISDAVVSVAHFLIANGWNDKDPESQVKALFAYNHSKDYGAVILKLADAVTHPSP